jgi:4-hydroxybenzoate polyprenyltransferase
MIEAPAQLVGLSHRPLVVDLDGTLCQTDTLWENFFAAWRLHWWLPVAASFWLLTGRTRLKAHLAEIALPSVDSLPWNEAVINALKHARNDGRTCVLATAAHERVAYACADKLRLFDKVFASTDRNNLKGEAKASLLVATYGENGFDYVGDSRADLSVWQKAAKKYTVSDVVPHGGEPLHPRPERSSLAAWAKLLRIRHWVKNVLVFVAPVAAHSWANVTGWQAVALTFAAFCAVCSGVYILNDLFDLAADRLHPSKRNRPLAAGVLPLAPAFAVALVLLALGLATALFAGPWVAAVVLAYLIVNAIYTGHLKRVPVFDVFCLAGLYTLRIVAGAAAVVVPLSTWLVAFSVFAFLSLALLKRAADIARLSPDELLPGRGYTGRDAAFVSGFGIASAVAACLVLALYVASDQVASMYATPLWLWGLAVVVLLWLARMWRMAISGTMDDDPVLFATRDGVSWGCAAVTVICVLLAL